MTDTPTPLHVAGELPCTRSPRCTGSILYTVAVNAEPLHDAAARQETEGRCSTCSARAAIEVDLSQWPQWSAKEASV